MQKRRLILTLFCLMQFSSGWAWNALGHKVIAQIAYYHMNERAKQVFNQYNRALDKVYKPLDFIDAAAWLDTLRYQNIQWFSSIHYIEWFFSKDRSSLPPTPAINAVWGVEQAFQILKNSKASEFDKGFSLRVLVHVVGDLHQPLHAATEVSKRFPKGDQGGNLVRLGRNSPAKSLHRYWDQGAGLFLPGKHYSRAEIHKLALGIEHEWPCELSSSVDQTPQHWASESHQIAIHNAYRLSQGEVPSKEYQTQAQQIVKKRVALAGCRLAALLNSIVQ